jgi:predicted outer membrane protein
MRNQIGLAWLAMGGFALLSAPAGATAQNEVLTDGQIAHAIETAATISVEAAELADSLAIGDETQAFATSLAADYRQSIARVEALTERLGFSEQADPVSEALREEADDEVAKIDDLGGVSFDRSYLKRVIEYHRAFLDMLERDLMPQVRSEDLDALLGEVQAEFASHLAEAEALAATL